MATMNGAGESTKKQAESQGQPTQQTTTSGNGKGLTYESPFPQILAGIDTVTAEIRRTLVTAQSQRFAASALWFLTKVASVIELLSGDPDHAPHPVQLDKDD